MSHAQPVFRFAPSPNGFLHLGHAYSALFSWRMAQAAGGRFLLRIEDIDRERSRADYEAAILDDLCWLGLEWETPVRRQSEHFAFYAGYLARLKTLGVIYPCFASRKEIAAAVAQNGGQPVRDPDGAPVYPGLHKHLTEAERETRMASSARHALRLDMEKAISLAQDISGGPIQYRALNPDGGETTVTVRPERWGDIVLARKNFPASYHLAVVADDALQGVTHVTRGNDLRAATDIHRLLQILLNLPEPSYCHHPLVADETGRKLSKSFKDKSLKALRAEGYTRDSIISLAMPATP